MKRGDTVELDGGVVLRPPRRPGARGGSGTYRVDWYEDGERKQKARTALARAWELACESSQRLHAAKIAAATGHQPLATFGELARHYLDPEGHSAWGEKREMTVTSLTRNWLLPPHIIVTRPTGKQSPLADVPLQELTPSMLTKACSYVHAKRAWRTYRDVHSTLGTIMQWAIEERFMPPDRALRGKFERHKNPRSSESSNEFGSHLQIDPFTIPPSERLTQFAEALGERFGWRDQAQFEVMTWAGPRISEVLALRNDRRLVWDEVDKCWRINIFEQVRTSKTTTAPPKWGRVRSLWVPPWLEGVVDRLVDETEVGAPLFPAPRGGLQPATRWRRNRFVPVAEAIGWPELESWLDGTQDTRRFRWPPHTCRHHAATFMLTRKPYGLGLPHDDVADYLGHRSGWQVWMMYGHSMPDMGGRAMRAALDFGDPRAPSAM